MSKPLFVMREQNTLYGVWAENVREVQPTASTTPLPRKLPYFEGISNYKGTIIPVFSLKHISGKERAGDQEDKVLVIMDGPKGSFGLTVSEVLYVTEDTEETMAYDDVKLNNGILKISQVIRLEEPVFVLDVNRTLEEIGRQN